MYIKEAAEILGIEAHTIRYYEQEGLRIYLLQICERSLSLLKREIGLFKQEKRLY